MARRYNRTWREGGYVIDFKVGQSFGELQLKLRLGQNIEYVVTDSQSAVPNDQCGPTRFGKDGLGITEKRLIRPATVYPFQ